MLFKAPVPLIDLNRIEVANLHANSTANADIRIDDVQQPALTRDCACRAVASANRAACATFLHDVVTDERLADFCRAAFFVNVGFVPCYRRDLGQLGWTTRLNPNISKLDAISPMG